MSSQVIDCVCFCVMISFYLNLIWNPIRQSKNLLEFCLLEFGTSFLQKSAKSWPPSEARASPSRPWLPSREPRRPWSNRLEEEETEAKYPVSAKLQRILQLIRRASHQQSRLLSSLKWKSFFSGAPQEKLESHDILSKLITANGIKGKVT